MKKTVQLNNGVAIPYIGFGTFLVPDGEVTRQSVLWALQAGYRSIDTAAAYGNERGVGQALKETDVPRDDIFITTKVWNSDQGYDKALKAFDASMDRLGFDVLDMILIHWPAPMFKLYKETWRALERLYDEKRVRAIGVSNFLSHHLDDLISGAKVVPAVNQIEMHAYFVRTELLNYCAQKGILVEAWGPLQQGGALLKDAVLGNIANKYGKSIPQVALRYLMQLGVRVLPKSVHKNRITQNLDVFSFELDAREMESIKFLNTGKNNGLDPDTFDMATPTPV